MLADGGWHSTWDIMIGCRVTAVGTVMSELRANGAVIECRRFPEEERTEAQIFKYRMTRPVPATDVASRTRSRQQGSKA